MTRIGRPGRAAAGRENITGAAAAFTGTPARIEGGQRNNFDAKTVIDCSKKEEGSFSIAGQLSLASSGR
jgi:hypothetical protein